MTMPFEAVLHFWFEELTPEDWWKKDDALDAMMRQRFCDFLHHTAQGESYLWREHPEGALAEIIVLDQFSRNIYRNHPSAFAHDGMALALAQTAVLLGQDQQLPIEQARFLYMPYMHSESLIIHDCAVRLFSQAGLEENLDYELKHKAIIERFGRYPHRNAIMGRTSTPDEIEFLQQPGSSF